jgi:hypothetical protein
MPTVQCPEKQARALLVRDAIATLNIAFPSPLDDRFRRSILSKVMEQLKDLEPGQVTRLNESACESPSKAPDITEFRGALQRVLGSRYSLRKGVPEK